MPVSGSVLAKKLRNASSPPADAPMPTINGVSVPDAEPIDAAPGVFADFDAFFSIAESHLFWALYWLKLRLASCCRSLSLGE